MACAYRGLFWHDFWKVRNEKLKSIQAVMGEGILPILGTVTYESGQLLINKVRDFSTLEVLHKEFKHLHFIGPRGQNLFSSYGILTVLLGVCAALHSELHGSPCCFQPL